MEYGCKGEEHYIDDKFEGSAPIGLYYPIGSIVVKPGCTFKGFGDYNHQVGTPFMTCCC